MRSRRRSITALVAGAAMLGLVAWLLLPELLEDEVEPGSDAAPTAQQVEAGRYLARAGNCIACHTVQGQPEYSGGRRMPTPFGDIYSTNLTPDTATGLGAWTSADFWRALHHGKSRDGRRLYPAFPYTNYTLVTRADSDLIFAYLRSLAPVHSPRVAPELRFPYSTKLALMAWRALYFRPGAFEPRAQHDAQWNRGAYLVEGLGHCNACHTVRDRLGGIKRSADYAGGPIPMLGWDALPLTSDTPMSDDQARDLAELLSAGVSRTSVAIGPMAEVVFHSLQHLSAADIEAIVAYIRTLPRTLAPPAPRVPVVAEAQRKALLTIGVITYNEHCADCHGEDGAGLPYVYPALAGSRLVTSASATNLIQVVLRGGFGPSTRSNPRPYGMPPYDHQLSDEQLASVLTYVRNAWGNQAAPVSVAEVSRH